MANDVAYGFYSLADLWTKRVTEVGVTLIDKALQETNEEYNRQWMAINQSWVTPTIEFKQKITIAGSKKMQKLDEWGNPLPVVTGASYEQGYPIGWNGTAIGFNRETRVKMTVKELNDNVIEMLDADVQNLRTMALAAILNATAYTFNDKERGDLTINPLANGDTVKYMVEGASAPATHNHYLAQAAAISDAANPFPAIYTHLYEHVSNRGADYVAYIPTGLKSSILGLANFVEVQDTEIAYGANQNVLKELDEARINRIKGPGQEILGRVDKIWIVEYSVLPAGYMPVIALNNTPLLVMREDAAPELRGMVLEFNDVDGNREERRYLRKCGFAVFDRIAAVVQYIGAGAYPASAPTGFESAY